MFFYRNGYRKKRVLSLALLLFFLSASFPPPVAAEITNFFRPWNGSSMGNYAKGSGTEANPFIIHNASAFKYFMLAYHQGDYYKLSGDIDLNWKPIDPIGAGGFPFKGVLDGDGFAIKNVEIKASSLTAANADAGLFATLDENAVVKNLTIRGIRIHAKAEDDATLCVGAIAGSINKNAKIEKCFALDVDLRADSREDWFGGSSTVGGIVGAMGNGTIVHCGTTGAIHASADISSPMMGGGANAGGVIGTYSSSNTVEHCYSTASISAWNSTGMATAGGVIGHSSGPISYAYAKGSLSAIAESIGHANAGGVAGTAGGSDANIVRSFATGNMEAKSETYSNAGGVVGDIWPGNNQILKCYSTGDVLAETTGLNDDAITRAGGITASNGVTESESLIVKTYSVGSISANGVGKYVDQYGDTTSVGGITGHCVSSVTESYAYGAVSGQEQVYAHRGGIAGFLYTQDHPSEIGIKRNVWMNGTGQDPTLSADVGGIDHNDSERAVIENNKSIDLTAFRNQANFTDTPLGWNFGQGGDWCYTDLDGRAKPHLRAFFVDQPGDVLNTVNLDLVWAAPPALSVASNDVERTRIVAGEYTPDAGSFSFSGLPMGLGVTLTQDPGSPDTVVVSCDAEVLGWIGPVSVDYTIEGKPQVQTSFLLRVYSRDSACPLQVRVDELNDEIGTLSDAELKVSILSTDKVPTSQGTIITRTKCGNAVLTAVRSEDLTTLPDLIAPLPSYESNVRLGGLTDGNLLALANEMDLTGLKAFTGWAGLTTAQRLARLKGDGSLVAIGNAAPLIGPGGVSWEDAVARGIVVFNDDGLTVHYAMSDAGGSVSAQTGFLLIPDGGGNGIIEGKPIYLLTKDKTPTPTNPTNPTDPSGPDPGGPSPGNPGRPTGKPSISVEATDNVIQTDGGEVSAEFPVLGLTSNGSDTDPEDVRIELPDNWHDSGLGCIIVDGQIVVYGQPSTSGTYEITVTGVVDGQTVSTTLEIEVVLADVLHVTVASINRDDWSATVVQGEGGEEGGRNGDLTHIRLRTRWRSGASIGYHRQECNIKIYASGLYGATAWIEDASGDRLASADVVAGEKGVASAAKGGGSFEDEQVRILVIDGYASGDVCPVSVRTLTFNCAAGKFYRQTFEPHFGFTVDCDTPREEGSTNPGGPGDGGTADGTGGGGCSSGAAGAAMPALLLFGLLACRRRRA